MSSNGPQSNPLGNLAHIANNMQPVKSESHSPALQPPQQHQQQQQQPSPAHSFTHSNTSPHHHILAPMPAIDPSHSAGLVPSSSTSPPAPTLKSGKPKRMACVECRQQKSRCDAHEKHPNPCTRCSKKGLKCDLKSDYKRTYKRARIAQIEKEFSELKKTLTSSQAVELLNKAPSLATINGLTASPAEYSRGTSSAVRHSQSGWPKYPATAGNSPYNQSQYANSPASFAQSPPYPFPPTPQQQPYVGNNKANMQRPQQQWNSDHSPYPQESRYSSSDTNTSIPDTPLIARQFEPIVPRQPAIPQQAPRIRPIDPDEPLRIPDSALTCDTKSLDTVTLSPETIKSLYLEYVEHYHPILPVVDVTKGPERIYKLCPALFWVIMFVSLRRFYEDASLLIQLSPLVKSVLAEIMISPITRYNPFEEDEPILNVSSVYSTQAFLLYSYWPPITSSLSADSSYSTVATGFFQAIRIGLHTSSFPNTSCTTANNTNMETNQQQLAMAYEKAKTWIFCNIASQTIATAFGFPACVQFDSSFSSQSQNMPKVVLFMMELAQFEEQMAKSLNSNQGDGLLNATERLPLLKLLSKRLAEMEKKLARELPNDSVRKFQLLCTKVHLLTYYFMDSSHIAEFELNKGLVKLYNAASELVSHTVINQTRDKMFVKYLPGVYMLNLWQAGCIIGKLIHSRLKSVIDVGSGKQNYLAVVSLTAKASILKHDMAYRSSAITRNMWQLFRTLDEKKMSSLSISVRNRMSASVFFDCLNLMRAQAGITKLTSKTDEKQAEDAGLGEEENGSYEDESSSGEEAVVSDNEVSEKGRAASVTSQKSTPGSTTSSARVRKARSLSSTVDAESQARKIIRTIPLDPQPISVGNSKRSSIFKVVNTSSSTDSSPKVVDKTSPNVARSPYNPANMQQPKNINSPMGNRPVETLPSQPHQQENAPNQPFNQMVFNDSPIQLGLENLDMDSFDHDMLWKDVDSVMNDFGFHAL
ncbi:LEU3 [[Candida] subhashii]|uniref:LEU3 n=1 Tax=[Candida] subhashii TaxID=561895 RepID=A0A8J5URN2_9ASCO|nr:LEU3 [[Candida] subhashii]KAG7664787.1 LEU3 [[Candida] subhashii]